MLLNHGTTSLPRTAPEPAAAQRLCTQAWERIGQAQRANEFDMGWPRGPSHGTARSSQSRIETRGGNGEPQKITRCVTRQPPLSARTVAVRLDEQRKRGPVRHRTNSSSADICRMPS